MSILHRHSRNTPNYIYIVLPIKSLFFVQKIFLSLFLILDF